MQSNQKAFLKSKADAFPVNVHTNNCNNYIRTKIY